MNKLILILCILLFNLSTSFAEDNVTFTSSFTTGTIGSGSVSKLNFTIRNNSFNEIDNISFTDILPAGLLIATPSASISTSGVLSAPDGGGTFTFSDGVLASGEALSISLYVTSMLPGVVENAVLFRKDFNLNYVSPGGELILEYQIQNLNRDLPLSNINFTDDFDGILTGLEAIELPLNNACGVGSVVTGTGSITLSGGYLEPEETCSFLVKIQVPANATPGNYSSSSSSIAAIGDGSPVTGPMANDNFNVQYGPNLEVTVNPLMALPGDEVTFHYKLANPDPINDLTGLTFKDGLSDLLSLTSGSATYPASGFCGASSIVSTENLGSGVFRLSASNIEVTAGSTCEFDVKVIIPSNLNGGASFQNVINSFLAENNGNTVFGTFTPASVTVDYVPKLDFEFSPDKVKPGDIVNVNYTISLDENATNSFENISFTHDFASIIPGATISTLPDLNVCSLGGNATGTSSLNLSGGTLSPGESCSFLLSLQIPSSSEFGTKAIPVSDLTFEVINSGLPHTSPAISNSLEIIGLEIKQEFTPKITQAGETIVATYTITNLTSNAISNITFIDNLATHLVLLSANTPINSLACGSGNISLTSANKILVFTGGVLSSGANCSFSLELVVPVSATVGNYRTSIGSASFVSNAQTVTSVSILKDQFEVVTPESYVSFSKSFQSEGAYPGDLVTLEFTISNSNTNLNLTEIIFTDDIDAMLSGSTFMGLPKSDVCGTGSSLTGTSSLLTLSDGTLLPESNCVFSVDVLLPSNFIQSEVTNITSNLSAILGSNSIDKLPASADLTITDNTRPLVITDPKDSTICEGSDVKFGVKASGLGISYQWQKRTASTSFVDIPLATSDTLSLINVSFADDNTFYKCIVYNESNSTESLEAKLTVKPIPMIGITGQTSICEVTTLSLTASGGTGYSWTGPGGFTSNTALAERANVSTATTYAGVYSVTVTGSNSCTASATTVVSVKTIPVIGITGTTSICEGSALSLTASGGTGYSWTGPGGYTSNTALAERSNASTATTYSGVYSVTVTGSNSCIASATTVVSVKTIPVIGITGTTSICEGSTLSLTASGGTGYSWTGPGGFTSNTALAERGNASTATTYAGVYSVTVTGSNSCTASASITISTKFNPVINIVGSVNPATCNGLNGSVAFNSLNLPNGTYILNYTRNGNSLTENLTQNVNVVANNFVLDGLSAGDYSNFSISIQGCTGNVTAPVNLSDPIFIASSSNLGPYFEGDLIQLSASNGTYFDWTGPNGFSSSLQNPEITSAKVVNAGIYTAIITDTRNCVITATTEVVISCSSPQMSYYLMYAGENPEFIAPLTNNMEVQVSNRKTTVIAYTTCTTPVIESVKLQLSGTTNTHFYIDNNQPFNLHELSGIPDGDILDYNFYTFIGNGYELDNALGNVIVGPDVIKFWMIPGFRSLSEPLASVSEICIGGSFNVSTSKDGIFSEGNMFQVFLSDEKGGFSFPTLIGSATNPDNINCKIPMYIKGSNNYKIKVITTAPVVSSATSITNLRIISADLNLVSSKDDYSANTNYGKAINIIEAENKVTGSARVLYEAGRKIELNPGFKVENGSVFSAQISNQCPN